MSSGQPQPAGAPSGLDVDSRWYLRRAALFSTKLEYVWRRPSLRSVPILSHVVIAKPEDVALKGYRSAQTAPTMGGVTVIQKSSQSPQG